MILYINTKDQKQISVALKDKDKTLASLSEQNEYGSQVLLPLIKKLLMSSKSHLRGGMWRQITAIEVETGPGSFTGLRVGVSVANGLGYSLGISVNGKKIETELQY